MIAPSSDFRLKRLAAAVIERLRGQKAREIAGNTGWILFEKVMRAFLAAFVTAWVARYLGPLQYASIAYAMAIVTFFGSIAQLGLSGIVIRDLAREPQATGEILGTTMVLRVVAGVSGLVGALIFLFLTETSPQGRLVGAMIAAQLVFQPAEVIDFWLQSRLESRFGVRSRIVVTLTMAAFKVALILLGMPLWTFGLVLSAEFGLIAVAMIVTYHRHRQTVHLRFSMARARRLLREGWPFLVSALAIATYMRFDQLLLRHLDGAEALGTFAAIVPLAQAGHIIPQALVASLTPVIALELQRGEAAYHNALLATFRFLGALSLAVAVAIAIFGPLIVSLLLGKSYLVAVPALQVYGFTNVAVALGMAWNIWATISGKGHLLVVNTIVGGLISILANVLLVPRFGMMGAAVAANLAYFASGLLINFFTCRDVFFLQIGIGRLGRAVDQDFTP